jgi:hypothetical protein
LEQYVGGNFQKVVAGGGNTTSGTSLGHGTQMKLQYLLAGYFTSDIIFQMSEEQAVISQGQQAIIDVLSRQIAKAVISQQAYDDVTFAQNGNGILTNSSSAVTNVTNATLTFTAVGPPADTLGVNLLFEGMTVDVWDSTGSILRTPGVGAPVQILAIDYDARQVTLDQTITGLTTGDILALRQMTVYGPATLTSFQSGYPGTQGGSPTGGIGGDSFRHGYPYMTDTNASNYFYGKQKSSLPQLNPVRVNANSDTLQWEQGLRVVAKIKQKRPQKELWRDITGIAHSTQKAAAFELGMSISQKLLPGSEFGQSLDLVPSNQANSDEFNFAGMRCIESTRQDRSRIDFINFDKIGRAEASEYAPYAPGGQTMHVGRGSDGTLQTWFEWAFMAFYENVCFDAGAFARIDTLAPPSPAWDA